MPYVHFDTHRNVKNLKETAAIEKFLREFPPQPKFTPEMKADDVTWTDFDCTDKSSDEKTEKKTKEKMREINQKIKEKSEEKIKEKSKEKSNKKTDEKVKEPSIGVIEKDLYSSLPLHCRKTLSEFYYGTMLQKQKQVVTRHFREFWPDEDPAALMVDQLWMLVLFDGKWYYSLVALLTLNFGFPGTIITSFPCQLGGIQREFPYIYADAVEELLGALRKRSRDSITTTLADLVSIIIGECSGFLFNQRSRSDKRFRFLNLYEQEISNAVSTRHAGGGSSQVLYTLKAILIHWSRQQRK